MRLFTRSLALIAVAAACVFDARGEVTLTSPHYVVVAPTRKIAAERQRELEWSAGVFELLLGVAPPLGKVILSESPPGSIKLPRGMGAMVASAYQIDGEVLAPGAARWTLPWFANESFGPRGTRQFSGLTHEASHLQLIHTVNGGAAESLRNSFNGYGSFLPDWIDEAVAVFHEPDGLKAVRRAQFKVGKRIPLKKFFAMSHPMEMHSTPTQVEGTSMAEIRQKIAAIEAQHAQSLQASAAKMVRNVVQVNRFYVQALAVAEYMTATGGLPFFRFVIDQQNRGRTMDELLRAWPARQQEIVTLRAQDPGRFARRGAAPELAGVPVRAGEAVRPMPTSVEALEAEFVRWIKQNYPRYRPPMRDFPATRPTQPAAPRSAQPDGRKPPRSALPPRDG